MNLKSKLLFIHYIRYCMYLFVLIGYSISIAGSYEDFFLAIRHDDSDTVTTLLQRGFDVNTLSPVAEHGLIVAVRESSVKVAKVLIKWPKVNINARNEHDETALMLAALKGLTQTCRELVAMDADINHPGWTALHYAATNGHLEIMDMLLQNNAYIDAASPNNTTPLMMAARYATPSAVKLLLEAGADPELLNDQNMTAIDFANSASRAESAALIAAFVRGRQPKESW